MFSFIKVWHSRVNVPSVSDKNYHPFTSENQIGFIYFPWCAYLFPCIVYALSLIGCQFLVRYYVNLNASQLIPRRLPDKATRFTYFYLRFLNTKILLT